MFRADTQEIAPHVVADVLASERVEMEKIAAPHFEQNLNLTAVGDAIQRSRSLESSPGCPAPGRVPELDLADDMQSRYGNLSGVNRDCVSGASGSLWI